MRRTGSKVGVGLAALVLGWGAGCADTDSGGEPKESGDFADLSGQEIADAAEEDMLALESMQYAGSLTSDGTEITLDIQSDVDGNCAGSIQIAGGSVEVLATGGESWFRADAAFWNATVPDQAAQIIALVGDKFVLDSSDEFGQFCDLDQFRDSLFDESSGETTYTNLGADEIDGQAVVEVESKDQEGTSIGYVLVEGEHYLVRIESDDEENSGEVAFSAFDEDFTVEAPAADEVIDLNDL